MITLIKPLHNLKKVVSFWSAMLVLMFAQVFNSAVVFGQGTGSTVAGFEVDASFKSGFIPPFWKTSPPNQNYTGGLGDDWSKGTTGNAVLKQLGGVSVPGLTADRSAIWQIDGNWGTNVPPDMSVFGGGSNKNGDLIGVGQEPYAISTGSGGPQKNDITNVMLHTRRSGDNLWLFFAAETRSINGSSYLDFEYNQAGVTTDGGQMIGLGPVGGRTVNDILMVVNYTQGGKTPIVGVRKWQADGTWSEELPLTPGTNFMTTNTQAVDAVAPNASYLGDGTPANSSLAFQVVEGALNVSSLNLEGLDQCTPNATVTVKTRSSASYTSELKDWDILHFPLTPAAVAAVANITPQCESKSGPTLFNVTGTYADGTPEWSSSAGTSLSNQIYNADGTASATLSVPNGIYNATVTLTTSSSNANCPQATSTKSAVVYPNPAVVASASPAGSLSILTAAPQYELHTTVNGVLDPASGYTFSWAQDPPAGGSFSSVIIPDPTFSATAAGQFTWTVTATDGNGCFNSSPVIRELIPQAPCPAVTTPSMCAGTSYTFSADVPPAAGETWTWSANNGAIVNAPNGQQSVSVTAGSLNFTLTLTKTYANEALDPQICPYEVTVNPAAVNPVVTMNVIACTDKTMTIQITNPQSNTTYDIYQLNQNHVIAEPPHSTPLVVSGLALGEGYRVIGMTDNGCVSEPTDCGDFSSFEPTSELISQAKVAPAKIVKTAAEEKVAKTESQDQINIVLPAGKPSVLASPNPYTENIHFTVTTEMSGYGTLEVFNLMGQKIKTVYEGNFEQAKTRRFEFEVPYAQRKNLIYVFRMGTQKTSGLLIGTK